MRHARMFGIAFLLGLSTTTMAADFSVLGITFDSPFSGQPCPTLGIPGGQGTVKASAVEVPCIDPYDISKWQERHERDWTLIKVWIPIEKLPFQIKNPVTVTFMGGSEPRSMTFTFSGLSANLAVIKLLEEKFGAPKEKHTIEKQNVYGAKYPVTEAKWETDEMAASLKVSSIDNGTVYVWGPFARRKSLEKSHGTAPTPTPGL